MVVTVSVETRIPKCMNPLSQEERPLAAAAQPPSCISHEFANDATLRKEPVTGPSTVHLISVFSPLLVVPGLYLRVVG